MLGPFVLRGLVDAILATITGLFSTMAALVVYGLGTSTGAFTLNSLLQAEIPDKLRGRIFATFDMLRQSGRLVGTEKRKRGHLDIPEKPIRSGTSFLSQVGPCRDGLQGTPVASV